MNPEPHAEKRDDIAPPPHAPEVLRFSIGGFGPIQTVEWQDGALKYKGYPFPEDGREESATYSPTHLQWKQFWRAMERDNVWNWQAEYFEPVLDGTSWELAITHGGKHIESQGSNGFPGGKGSDYGKNSDFARFLRALKTLTGGREFS